MNKKKGLDILFVHPSFTNVYQKKHEALHYAALEPPYRTASMVEFIKNKGFSAEIIDANALGLLEKEAAKLTNDIKPRLVQLEVHGNQPSASSQLMDWVIKFSKELKSYNAEYKILLTGTHPAALPERTIQDEAGDFVGRGDGYHTTLGLLQGLPLSDIPGLWYKEGGKVVRGKKDSLMPVEEMNRELKRASWESLPIAKYRAHDWHCLDNLEHRQPYAAIYTSTGCSFGCEFCCINAPFNDGGERANTIRCRDSKIVVDEIEELIKMHGCHPANKLNLKIIDEMFVFNVKHYKGIAQELINRNIGGSLNTWAYSRVDTVNENNLELLKKAGFNWLVLGIESGSALVRDGVEKGKFKDSDIAKVVKSIKNAGIYVLGNYIFGLPDDTEQSMQATFDMAVALECERPNFYCAMAYPGSYLHTQAMRTASLYRERSENALEQITKQNKSVREHNLNAAKSQEKKLPYLMVPKEWNPSRPLLPEDIDLGAPGWIGYSQHSFETLNLPTETLLPEEVLKFRDKVLDNYFRDENYIGMLSKKFGEKTAREFSEMNAVTPKRKLLGHTKD